MLTQSVDREYYTNTNINKKKMSVKISVIIPSYKPLDYIWDCLNSIYNQTLDRAQFEVLLVLNGCCEPWNTKILTWISTHTDLNINYIQTDQGGVSNARNIALDNAKGEYVTFIDDDDFVSEQYLELMLEKASEDVISLCYPYAFMDGNKRDQIKYGLTTDYDNLNGVGLMYYPRARKYFSGPCMKLIPMRFIQGRRYDVRFKNGEDSLFMFLISDKINKVAFTSKDAIYYRRYRKNSAMTSKKSIKEIIVNPLKLLTAYTSILVSNPLSYKFSFYFSRVRSAINSIIVGLINY